MVDTKFCTLGLCADRASAKRIGEDSYSPPYLTHPEVRKISMLPLGLEPGSAVSHLSSLDP